MQIRPIGTIKVELPHTRGSTPVLPYVEQLSTVQVEAGLNSAVEQQTIKLEDM
jgi:hypothetical protein